jgi:hypothetical protein
VGPYACSIGAYLDGGSSYLSSPLGGLVLSVAWRRDGACSEMVVLSVLADGAGVPVPIRAGILGGARPLTVPPKGRDEGEVVRHRVACNKGRRRRSWVTSCLSIWPESVQL